MSGKRKKGLSLEEKRTVILNLHREVAEPLNLKEIESLASKRGVVQQTIKEVNQSLVDDNMVNLDKIGSSNFFWSFPSKEFSDKIASRDYMKEIIPKLNKSIESKNDNLITLQNNDRSLSNRSSLLEELSMLKQKEILLKNELEKRKFNDPEEINRILEEAKKNKISSDRWTDNLFCIKNYMMKKRGMTSKEVNQYLRIDENLDYCNYDTVSKKKKAIY